jgi:hypothetical protein
VSDDKHKTLLAARSKATQLDVSIKTLDRWAAAGIISQPTKIRNRKYWDADEKPRVDGEVAA